MASPRRDLEKVESLGEEKTLRRSQKPAFGTSVQIASFFAVTQRTALPSMSKYSLVDMVEL